MAAPVYLDVNIGAAGTSQEFDDPILDTFLEDATDSDSFSSDVSESESVVNSSDISSRLINEIDSEHVCSRSVPFLRGDESARMPTYSSATHSHVHADIDGLEIFDTLTNICGIIRGGSVTVFGEPKRVAIGHSKLMVRRTHLRESPSIDFEVEDDETTDDEVKVSQLLMTKIGEVHCDWGSHVGLWLSLPHVPSKSRPTTFWTNAQNEVYYDAIATGKTAARISEDHSESGRRGNFPIIDELMFGPGIGDNAIIPLRAFLTFLSTLPAVSEMRCYIKCVGMKRVLTWSTSDERDATVERLYNVFDLSSDAVQHRIDVCIELSVAESAVLCKRQWLTDFCQSLHAQHRHIYNILGLVETGNVQCATTSDQHVTSINMYTSYLTALRARGQIPTIKCKPVSHQVYLLQQTGTDLSRLSQQLLSNASALEAVTASIRGRGQRSFPFRCEVTTTIAHLDDVLERVSHFYFEESNLAVHKFIFLPTSIFLDILQASLTFVVKELASAASVLSARGHLEPSQLQRLAVAEELGFDTLLYGRISSSYLLQQRRLAWQSNSLLMPVPLFHESMADQSSEAFIRLLPKRSQHIPVYAIAAISDMVSKVDQAGDLTDTSVITKLSDELACIIVRTLDAELSKSYLRRKYVTIKHDLPYLSMKHPNCQARFKITSATSDRQVALTLRRLFFITRDVKGMQYTDLHSFAVQRLLSKGVTDAPQRLFHAYIQLFTTRKLAIPVTGEATNRFWLRVAHSVLSLGQGQFSDGRAAIVTSHFVLDQHNSSGLSAVQPRGASRHSGVGPVAVSHSFDVLPSEHHHLSTARHRSVLTEVGSLSFDVYPEDDLLALGIGASAITQLRNKDPGPAMKGIFGKPYTLRERHALYVLLMRLGYQFHDGTNTPVKAIREIDCESAVLSGGLLRGADQLFTTIKGHQAARNKLTKQGMVYSRRWLLTSADLEQELASVRLSKRHKRPIPTSGSTEAILGTVPFHSAASLSSASVLTTMSQVPLGSADTIASTGVNIDIPHTTPEQNFDLSEFHSLDNLDGEIDSFGQMFWGQPTHHSEAIAEEVATSSDSVHDVADNRVGTYGLPLVASGFPSDNLSHATSHHQSDQLSRATSDDPANHPAQPVSADVSDQLLDQATDSRASTRPSWSEDSATRRRSIPQKQPRAFFARGHESVTLSQPTVVSLSSTSTMNLVSYSPSPTPSPISSPPLPPRPISPSVVPPTSRLPMSRAPPPQLTSGPLYPPLIVTRQSSHSLLTSEQSSLSAPVTVQQPTQLPTDVQTTQAGPMPIGPPSYQHEIVQSLQSTPSTHHAALPHHTRVRSPSSLSIRDRSPLAVPSSEPAAIRHHTSVQVTSMQPTVAESPCSIAITEQASSTHPTSAPSTPIQPRSVQSPLPHVSSVLFTTSQPTAVHAPLRQTAAVHSPLFNATNLGARLIETATTRRSSSLTNAAQIPLQPSTRVQTLVDSEVEHQDVDGNHGTRKEPQCDLPTSNADDTSKRRKVGPFAVEQPLMSRQGDHVSQALTTSPGRSITYIDGRSSDQPTSYFTTEQARGARFAQPKSPRLNLQPTQRHLNTAPTLFDTVITPRITTGSGNISSGVTQVDSNRVISPLLQPQSSGPARSLPMNLLYNPRPKGPVQSTLSQFMTPPERQLYGGRRDVVRGITASIVTEARDSREARRSQSSEDTSED